MQMGLFLIGVTILEVSCFVDVITKPKQLYSRAGVTIATFIGMPLAGCLLLAANYRQLENTRAALKCIIWGAAVSIMLLVGAYFLPDSTPNSVVPIAYTIAMFNLATRLQGNIFTTHLQNGGRAASNWKAAGVGFLALLMILGLVFIVCIFLPVTE
jgi:hypothetical protein